MHFYLSLPSRGKCFALAIEGLPTVLSFSGLYLARRNAGWSCLLHWQPHEYGKVNWLGLCWLDEIMQLLRSRRFRSTRPRPPRKREGPQSWRWRRPAASVLPPTGFRPRKRIPLWMDDASPLMRVEESRKSSYWPGLCWYIQPRVSGWLALLRRMDDGRLSVRGRGEKPTMRFRLISVITLSSSIFDFVLRNSYRIFFPLQLNVFFLSIFLLSGIPFPEY